MLPFLRSMVKHMKHNDFIYLFVGYLIFTGLIPCLEYCLWKNTVTLNENFSVVFFVTQNVFFSLMGYYLEHVFDKKNNKKMVIISIICSILSILVTCLITNYQVICEGIGNTEQLEVFFPCFICIPAMTVYLLIKFTGSKINGKKSQKIISILGSAVFGVYLIEKICRIVTGRVYILLLPIVGSFVSSLIWCLATCCMAFFVIAVFIALILFDSIYLKEILPFLVG
jgi:peptidoglycan/LPS O-acetylase OafA/YrhL